MTWADIVIPIMTALLGGGIIGIWKLKPEVGQIVVKSAESVVIMQNDWIDKLNAEMDEIKEEHKNEVASIKRELQSQKLNMLELRAELSETKSQRDELAAENRKLKTDVARLTNRVKELEDKNGKSK